MADVSHSFAIVCEAPADKRTGCAIADRVLCEAVDWLRDSLGSFREWRGERREASELCWKHVPSKVEAAGLEGPALYGFFGEKPGEPDALIARRALVLLMASDERPAAVLLLRDSDGDARRKIGLDQARSDPKRKWPFRIVVGVANAKREAWILQGFIPASEDEKQRLQRARDDLSFDPTREPDQLDASEHGAKRDAKRVLRELLQIDREREERCLTEPALSHFETHTADTGVKEFIAEVREHLVPIFTS